MNVLVFSPYLNMLQPALEKAGDKMVLIPRSDNDFDFIISFGYRHIIKGTVLDRYRHRMINIHISLLPWNRGADCNFWSWFDDTPKGVSIHYIDAGIDTGPIIAQQKLMVWKRNETLKSSWLHLMATAKDLFEREWPNIRKGHVSIYNHHSAGSFHKIRDKEPWNSQLPLGWETPVKQVINIGKSYRANLNLSRASNIASGRTALVMNG